MIDMDTIATGITKTLFRQTDLETGESIHIFDHIRHNYFTGEQDHQITKVEVKNGKSARYAWINDSWSRIL